MEKTSYIKSKEDEVRPMWKGLFNTDVDDSKESYMGTFPYPYVNGPPHMGHISTLSKVEFMTQYQRSLGKNVRFPFAFHATGMPIEASANKLKFELENPESLTSKESKESYESNESEDVSINYKSSKSKLASKQGSTQIETMKMMGIPDDELSQFKKPWYWVEYFIPKYVEVLDGIGFGVDTRCQFTTTDMNPYYDKFVSWQFKKLHENGKLKYGKRYSIYSPKDGQPCQDHDRSSGEGVKCQEYTLVNFRVLNTNGDKPVNLVTATLRPETMFGLTNVWVHPDMEYHLYDHKYEDVDDQVIMLPNAYNNLKYQEHILEFVKVIKGSELIGLEVSQCQSDKKLYVLPMYQILPTKGTGIVSSVPTESPDDYLNLYTLMKPDHPNRKKMIETFPQLKDISIDVKVPIIKTDDDSIQIAIDFCELNNIKNPSGLNGVKLQEAKKQIYTKSRKGVFIIEDKEYNGKSVEDSIPGLKKKYLKTKDWYDYAEPESEVISRSNDKCVASLENQWYIDYGEETWKQQVKDHMDEMNFYNDKAKQQFEQALDWLGQWPFTRTMGLGTKLDIPCPNPDDKTVYLIDSLSDSTIYMALYTIYPILSKIPQELINDSTFDYVFLDIPLPKEINSPYYVSLIDMMRKSFNYWYPMDLRVSGKDLTQNHLLMCIYNHVAIFQKKHCPKSFRINGHVAINGEKMSKSKGNFLTAKYMLDTYGADAFRLTMASGTSDPIQDSNYISNTKTESGMPEIDIISSATGKIYDMYQEMEQFISKLSTDSYRKGEYNFFDTLMTTQIDKIIVDTKKYMDNMQFYEAMQQSFNYMIHIKDEYKKFMNEDYHKDVIERYISVFCLINTPFTPHMCEYVYQKYNDYKTISVGSIRNQRFPEPTKELDTSILYKYEYIDTMIQSIKKHRLNWIKKEGKTEYDLVLIVIAFGEDMVDWQKYVASLLDPMIQEDKPIKDINKELSKDVKLREYKLNFKKKVQPFVANYVNKYEMYKFDKMELMKQVIHNLSTYFDVAIEIEFKEDVDPMKPHFTYK